MQLDHIAFEVANWDKALDFFTKTLGLEVVFEKRVEYIPDRIGCRIAFIQNELLKIELLEGSHLSDTSNLGLRFDHLGVVTQDIEASLRMIGASAQSPQAPLQSRMSKRAPVRVSFDQDVVVELLPPY